METITYLLIALFSSVATYYYFRKKNIEIIAKLENVIEINRKNCIDEVHRKNNLVYYQKEILYWISDGIHNIGSVSYQEELSYDKKKFKKEIGRFFSITRVLTEDIKNEEYTKNELDGILNFIKDDFGNYCHYLTKDLDLDKYANLVIKEL